MQDYRLSFYITGFFGCIFSILMFIPAIVEYYSGMKNFDIFINSACFCLFVSVLIVVTSYSAQATITHHSSFLATTLVWFVLTFISAVPLYFAHYPGYSIAIADALFEASSGITTTGASVLTNIDNVSKGILLWRAMLHFVGGIGIITMVFIVMPYLQNGAMYFFLTESSENQEKETARIVDFVVIICLIYLAFGVMCACAYYFLGMNAFDAICHAMATISSGGFGTHDSSFIFFSNPFVETSAIFFMILAGVPFVMIVRLFTRRRIIFSSQVLTMLYIFLLSTLSLCLVYGVFGKEEMSFSFFRHMMFAVVSVGTSTGFASSDFSYYGGFFLHILLLVSVVGGCTGSTSGGIKVFRLQVVYQIIKHHFLKILYPHAVAKIKCDGQEISESTMRSVIILIALYILSSIVSVLIITIFGYSFDDAVSTTVSMLSNSGMIVSEYGTSSSILLQMPQSLKGMFAVLMILGRLEFITVFVIISQIFKKD